MDRNVCLIALSVCAVTPAMAGHTGYATRVESVSLGLQKSGEAVHESRAITANALGVPELNYESNFETIFLSLGYGGEVVLAFGGLFGEQVTVWETTYGDPAGHYERADVYVGWQDTPEPGGGGQDTGPNARPGQIDWWLVGSVDNMTDGVAMSLDAVSDLAGRSTFQYVRIVDTTPGDSPSFDGFDIDGVAVTMVPAPGAMALGAVGGLALARRRRR